MNKEELIEQALRLPSNAISYYVNQMLTELFPDKAVIESQSSLFDVEEYARDGQCHVLPRFGIPSEFVTDWEEPDEDQGKSTASEGQLSKNARNAWLETKWRGETLEVLIMGWWEAYNRVICRWILADSKESATQFLEAVCRWNSEVRGELLVFDSGCWHKDERLYQAIKDATFENLILQGTLKQDIRADLERFFDARDVYEKYRIPWKRGILFVGPPGNGKTHAVKALINSLDRPCLYVKSFKAEYSEDEDNIHDVFKRARKAAPCILVLEDLDSLLTDENRSFFLNELDGFATNTGIITLATTNHPERLDPAIMDRPSRFDRKYPFELPGLQERIDYIQHWNAILQEAMQLPTEAIEHIASLTEDFSFAYLKELFLSSMMKWIIAPQPDIMDTLMSEQVIVLREQMASARRPDTIEHKDN
ncbi:MAG: ATP-binding protein [Chloroflexota bacterium]|nr:ATP-binding protein [Chloroflexota bacterium]